MLETINLIGTILGVTEVKEKATSLTLIMPRSLKTVVEQEPRMVL